jgi:DNA-binding beta-propeller fold protein YncE
MNSAGPWRGWLVALTVAWALVAAAPAQGAVEDPLFVFKPMPPPPPAIPPIPPEPPPAELFEGACGLAVDSTGRFYVSDYYHDTVDAFSPSTSYLGQVAGIDTIDGPCGLAFDASDRLYVNDYHRAVVRYGAFPSFGLGIQFAGATVDGAHPTGVAVDPSTGTVYVDERTHIAAYDESGTQLTDAIGEGSLDDGYGLAFSSYPGTEGLLYVADAASNTVKVYDPSLGPAAPVAEIEGPDIPGGGFTSLRDAAVAVDRVSGEVYVVDDLQPQYAERPEAIVDVFDATGAYEGHLKLPIVDALPAGLAVDNSATATQGRVYVASGNTNFAAVYAYGPGAATTTPVALSSDAPSGGGQDSAPPSSSAAPTSVSVQSPSAPARSPSAAVPAASQPALSARLRSRRRSHHHRARRRSR